MIDDSKLRRLSVLVGTQLKKKKVRVVTAESCTGGFIAKILTDIEGSSAWFSEGFVTYSNESKIRLLGVTSASLVRYGAVSEQTARQMAVGALRRSGSGIAVAVTGIAGPGGGTPGKPVGTIWLAWVLRHGRQRPLVAVGRRFRGDRDEVRRKTVQFALQGLLRMLR